MSPQAGAEKCHRTIYFKYIILICILILQQLKISLLLLVTYGLTEEVSIIRKLLSRIYGVAIIDDSFDGNARFYKTISD